MLLHLPLYKILFVVVDEHGVHEAVVRLRASLANVARATRPTTGAALIVVFVGRVIVTKFDICSSMLALLFASFIATAALEEEIVAPMHGRAKMPPMTGEDDFDSYLVTFRFLGTRPRAAITRLLIT